MLFLGPGKLYAFRLYIICISFNRGKQWPVSLLKLMTKSHSIHTLANPLSISCLDRRVICVFCWDCLMICSLFFSLRSFRVYFGLYHVLSPVQALGCILYLLCFKQHPFEEGAKLQIVNGKYSIPQNDVKYTVYHDLIRTYLRSAHACFSPPVWLFIRPSSCRNMFRPEPLNITFM